MDGWMEIEHNLDVLRSPRSAPDGRGQLSRKLGSLLLDIFRSRDLSPEVAETLTLVVLEQVIMRLPEGQPPKRGWFESWCGQIADRVQKNWDIRGKSTNEFGDDLMVNPEGPSPFKPGESACHVVMSFLSPQQQRLFSWVHFDGVPLSVVAERLLMEEKQVSKEYIRTRNRLRDLFMTDKEIPEDIRNDFGANLGDNESEHPDISAGTN